MGGGARLREPFPDVVVAAAEPLPGDPVIGLRSLEDGYVPADPRRLAARPQAARHERASPCAGVRALLEREGDLRRRLLGRRRARRAAARGGARRGRRRGVLADGGWKYLSAPFWEAEDVEQAMEQAIWW